VTSIVQSVIGAYQGGHSRITENYPTTPTPGNQLIALLFSEETPTGSAIDSDGWVELCAASPSFGDTVSIWAKVAEASEPTAVSSGDPGTTGQRALHLFELDGLVDTYGTATDSSPGTTTGPTLTASDDGILIAGMVGRNQIYVGLAVFTGASPLTADGAAQKAGRMHKWSAHHSVTTSTSYTPTVTVTGDPLTNGSAIAAVIVSGEPEDIEIPVPPADPGVDVPYVPPEPAGALLEIRATTPGAARWDIALWDEAIWAAAAWQDVTPQGITALIRWGSTRPELGILSQPSAGTWAVTLHDPERLLDPANSDTPYVGDLVPGLPIRLSHRGVVVRTGIVESIGYQYKAEAGYIRATDNQSTLARAAVPSDSELGDTLRARARDAIVAADLSIEVEPDPPAGDPALVPWEAGTDRTAWEWIADAAQSVLHVPYIDRNGSLGFRAWSAPLTRGRTLDSSELIELQAIAAPGGLYSVIEAQPEDPDDPRIVRRLTPSPRYGARTFVRDEPTPDAPAWAEAVLADRALPGIRWVPGDLLPSTADSVELLALIEAVELVSISVPEVDPVIEVGAIVVGGEITVRGRRDLAAAWGFSFEAAQAPAPPLVVDDSDPPEFLLSEAADEFLYPG
jgi:hypothetical protein